MERIQKGGKGKAAPYKTKMVRVPEPIAEQVMGLINSYQNYLANGGDANNPPEFITKQFTLPEAIAEQLTNINSKLDLLVSARNKSDTSP